MRNPWFWKLSLTIAICVFVWVNFELKPTDPIHFQGVILEYKPGAKAAIFAMISAAFLIVSWIRTDVSGLDELARWSNRLATAITGFLTGWYWLASATNDPVEHLGFVAALSTIIVIGFAMLAIPIIFLTIAVFGAFLSWLRRDENDISNAERSLHLYHTLDRKSRAITSRGILGMSGRLTGPHEPDLPLRRETND